MQGRGIGTALIRALELEHGAGAHTFALFTGDSNPANRRLYERLGYRETHTELTRRSACACCTSRSPRPSQQPR